MDIWGKWILVRRNSNCEKSEMAPCLIQSRNKKEASGGGSGGKIKAEIRK